MWHIIKGIKLSSFTHPLLGPTHYICSGKCQRRYIKEYRKPVFHSIHFSYYKCQWLQVCNIQGCPISMDREDVSPPIFTDYWDVPTDNLIASKTIMLCGNFPVRLTVQDLGKTWTQAATFQSKVFATSSPSSPYNKSTIIAWMCN